MVALSKLVVDDFLDDSTRGGLVTEGIVVCSGGTLKLEVDSPEVGLPSLVPSVPLLEVLVSSPSFASAVVSVAPSLVTTTVVVAVSCRFVLVKSVVVPEVLVCSTVEIGLCVSDENLSWSVVPGLASGVAVVASVLDS